MSQKKQKYEFNKQTPIVQPAVKKVETDEILSGTDKVQYILSEHWKKIAIGIGAIVVVVIALIVIKFVREHNDLQLRHQLAAAKTVEELQELTDANADHPSAIPALFRLGALYAADNENAKAAEAFKKIYDAQDNVNDFDRLRAGIASAYQLEAAGREKEAIALFVAISQDQTIQAYPALLQEAICNAARLYVKNNDKAAAAALLEKIVSTEQNAGFWQQQCAALKEQLAEVK